MFISGNMIKEIVILVNLSARHPDLITWSSFNYRSMLLFFSKYSKEIGKVYKCAMTYLKILHGEGSVPLPLCIEYKEDAKVLNLFSSMDKNEMKLFLSLFASSAIRHLKQGQVRWTIHLINKEITFVGFNEANQRLQNVLKRQFHYLKWSYAGKSVYLVRQLCKRVPPLMSIPLAPPFCKEHKNFVTSQKAAWASQSPLKTGDSNKLALNLSLQPPNDIPLAILKHPRFAMSSKKEDGLHAQKALFSRTMNTHVRSRCAEVIPLFTKTSQCKGISFYKEIYAINLDAFLF